MTTYNSINEIKDANQSLGHHFFEAATMRFFNSKIASRTVYGGRYFITSEQFVGSDHVAAPRRYTIRRANDDGSIDTIGDFQTYASVEEARKAVKELVAFNQRVP